MATMMVVQSQTLRSARVRNLNAIHKARGRHTTRVCDYSGHTASRRVYSRLARARARANEAEHQRVMQRLGAHREGLVYLWHSLQLYLHPKFSRLHMIWRTLPQRQ